MSRHLLNSISSSIIWVRHVCGVYVCVCQWLTYTMMIQPAQPSVIAAIAESCQWTVMIRIPSVWPFMAKKSYFSISFFARLIKVAPLSLLPIHHDDNDAAYPPPPTLSHNEPSCVCLMMRTPTNTFHHHHHWIIHIYCFVFFFCLVLFGWSHFSLF